MNETKNKPVRKYRVGQVSLDKWVNKTKEGNDFATYSLQVSYKDETTGEYKESKSYSKSILANIRSCIDKALSDEVIVNANE